MSPRRLGLSLTGLQLAAFATLLRSVAFDRWITVAVSVALLIAAYAAQRGRTWGVALSFALGITFAGVAALGIAPLWFAFVGLLAVRPFLRMFHLFTSFDRGAALTLAGLATTFGAFAAVAWKAFALSLFAALPLLSPSIYPHHGLALLALLAGGIFGRRLLPGANEADDAESGVTDHARVRVADATDTDAAAYEELEAEIETPSRSTAKR